MNISIDESHRQWKSIFMPMNKKRWKLKFGKREKYIAKIWKMEVKLKFMYPS